MEGARIHASMKTCLYTSIEPHCTISLHCILQLLILVVLFPKELPKQTTSPPFSHSLSSPLSLPGDETQRTKKGSVASVLQPRSTIWILGAGIQDSFLCTLHNVIIVLLLAQQHLQHNFVFCGLECRKMPTV